MKRAFDVAVSGGALAALAGPLGLIALVTRLDSPGPVLFRQTRIGKDRRPFEILKFRTMVHRPPGSVDQHQEAVVSGGEDSRITRAGRLLRRTSLDELPQLWNILRGEMSIVGPRPVLPEQLEVVPPELMTRFEVRPGLTGLAQVRGRRSLGWMEQLACDAEYVATRSFLGDLAIVARTFRVVLSGSGVYADASRNWRAYRGRVAGEGKEPEIAGDGRAVT